jgi:hypothetical protein
MDKKVLYGLGAVALVGGVIWYMKNKKDSTATSMVEEEAMAEATEDAGAGGGGGGGALPSPTDMAVGEMAKEEVRKSMDLGGMDMASSKVEKSAKATAMVGSMIGSGKSVPREMVKSVLKAPIPKGLKGKILSASQSGAIKPLNVMKSVGVKPAVKSGIGKITSAVKSASPSIKGKIQGLKSKFKKFDGDEMDNFDGASDF